MMYDTENDLEDRFFMASRKPREYNDEVKASLKKLESKYSQLGLVKGSELLLPPDIATNYVDDVASIGVVNMGLSGWYYIKPNDPAWIAEDWGVVDFYVGDDTMASENAAEESAAKIKQYIKTSLRDNTAFLSFTLDIPMEWVNEMYSRSEPD
jgi:hypothetical protein